MAEHEGKGQKTQSAVDQKQRLKQHESQPLLEKLQEWDTSAYSIAETPFQPRMDEHAELLAATRADEARSNLLIHLQQTYGNKYVQRLRESIAVQPKLTVNSPNDVYEQEADRVADAVYGATNSPIQRPAVKDDSAEPLLDNLSSGIHQGSSVQEVDTTVQRVEEEEITEQRTKFSTDVDTGEADDAIITSAKDLTQEMKGIISGLSKLIMVGDVDALAVKMHGEGYTSSVDEAKRKINANKGRAFTGATGTIYCITGTYEIHDILHETVHVCSAPGGKTKIMTETGGEGFNEGLTEFFTKRIGANISGYTDAPAYPKEVSFVKKIADSVGIEPLYKAYMMDEGTTPIAEALVDKWESNAGSIVKSFHKPSIRRGSNINAVKKNFTGDYFEPGAVHFLKYFTDRKMI